MRNDWISERIAELKSWGRKKSKSGLADALGLPPSRVTEIVAGERAVGPQEIVVIARYLEIPELQALSRFSDGALQESSLSQIFVIGLVQAGVWQKALEKEPEDWEPCPVSPDPRYAHCRQFGLRVVGPSMNEVYPDGSVVVCVNLLELGRDPRPGERVVVVRRQPESDDIEATIKELRQDNSGAYWLWPRSSDPNFQQPWPLRFATPAAQENEDVRIVSLVIGSYRPEG